MLVVVQYVAEHCWLWYKHHEPGTCGVQALNGLLGDGAVTNRQLRNLHAELGMDESCYMKYGVFLPVMLSVLWSHGLYPDAKSHFRGFTGCCKVSKKAMRRE